MLVLGRKRGQKIAIGPDIVVSVERIMDGEVRIGVTAPKELLILRTELTPNDDRTMKRLTNPNGGG
jgi:carbon storage regulator